MKLSNNIQLIVPKEDNEKRAINDTRIIQAVKEITQDTGGCTITENHGLWISETGAMMTDNNINYEWYFNDLETATIHSLKNAIEILITEYGQEAISLKINNELNLIFDPAQVTSALYQFEKVGI